MKRSGKQFLKRLSTFLLVGVLTAAGTAGTKTPVRAAVQSMNRPVAQVYQNSEQPISLYVFDGTVVKIKNNQKSGSGTVLMKEKEGGNEVLFRYLKETDLNVNMKKVKRGDRLNILYNGIMTRSLPPQAFAQEIRAYAKTDSYRGNITKITTKKGTTTLKLKREAGTPYADTLTVTFTKDTRTNLTEKEKLRKGDYVEVFYEQIQKKKQGRIPSALTVEKLLLAKMCVYTGSLIEIQPDEQKEGTGILVMKDDVNDEFLFHYSPETLFKTALSDLKPGDKLSIYHRGAVALSLPPQGGALEVSIYKD